ncbi:bsl1828 [Bradyrhizobium diazoefficiens USDA 110]|uniref:Bsl1828 protein n=3 Tax=Bradyrhizobium TaxID=374 RepID=Q89TP6_BRADU|nr:hypothetical protein AAV28_06065 [Bradyrhizobium diazoefficiens USDA 110]APO50447.1 hypothetical protein BD122_09370 [Bradyrhizobium diazoefficiens]AWL97891.1 hypothetical protein CIT37_04455 [Bradyrhizobium ottawaense]KGJ71361.1 hypothetical protein BJA5080_08068 [Bradyrhizobium diazoefficiens SEMIA 5080]MYV88551.1 hypothetical protein [Bradyrhizobium japonicum]
MVQVDVLEGVGAEAPEMGEQVVALGAAADPVIRSARPRPRGYRASASAPRGRCEHRLSASLQIAASGQDDLVT